jgi:HEAT repeat protein
MTKKGVWAVRKMAIVHAEEAIDKLVEIMRNEDADHNVQRQAANDLLNRAFGTPVSTQIVEKTITDERGSPIDVAALTKQDTETLVKLSKMLGDFVERDNKIIDVTPD